MPQKNELILLPTTDFILHELHPAHGLHPDIRERLINVFVGDDSKRRFTTQTLIRCTELRPITVSGTPKKPTVIAGWDLLYALQLYNVEDPVTCIARWGLSDSKIRAITYLDFFFEPQIDRYDEITQRIRAIVMNQKGDDVELKELLATDVRFPRDFFNLPIHKRQSLQKRIVDEPNAVRELISDTKRPLGSKELNSTKKMRAPKNTPPHKTNLDQNTLSKAADTLPNTPVVEGTRKSKKTRLITSAQDELFGPDPE